jgi:NADPH-dependent ferric siderophore reductase
LGRALAEVEAVEVERLLLVGDETALPAIASVLPDLDRGAGGHFPPYAPTSA